MKQYCRYCMYLYVQDNGKPYCEIKEKERAYNSCRNENRCEFYEFADVAPEYQDAFGKSNGYHELKK